MAFWGDETPKRKPLSRKDREALVKMRHPKQHEKCVYCGTALRPSDMHLDHKKPVERDGGNSVANFQLLRMGCNTMKCKMTDAEFRKHYKLTSVGPPSRPISREAMNKRGEVASLKKKLAAAKTTKNPWGW